LEEEKRKKKARTYWVHPLNAERLTSSRYYVQHAKLKDHPEEFKKIYRMSVRSFHELHDGIKEIIKKKYSDEAVFGHRRKVGHNTKVPKSLF
jgi:hypothetical protein